ncbi:MAG: hypothetical protein IT165_06665 [Bryobacterales bacterium]|nr:hypothetical protein [Bryobacterales bacterium]
MRAVQWLDAIISYLSPAAAGIRRSRARAALLEVGKPQREQAQQRPRRRGFNIWWEQRMAARGWGRW